MERIISLGAPTLATNHEKWSHVFLMRLETATMPIATSLRNVQPLAAKAHLHRFLLRVTRISESVIPHYRRIHEYS
jgi:hypothetical protein